MALFARELHEYVDGEIGFARAAVEHDVVKNSEDILQHLRFILSFHIWMSYDLHILRRRHRVAYMHRRSSQRRGRHNQAMMLNDRIQSISRLQFALGKGKEYLSKLPPDTPISDFEYKFQELGFEKGWGDNGHVSEMVHLLLDILQVPDPSTLETFLGRIPLVFNVVILSPHGYFGQANVLGLSDTGGQKRMLVALELMIQGAEESDASKSGNDLI